MNSRRLEKIILVGLLLLAAGWKTWLLLRDAFPFNSDEAVVALMARHILNGERPIFFYGQAYMGSLDAYFVAGGFALFGQSVWVVRLVQACLYLGTLYTTALIGARILGSWRIGLLAFALLAIPTVNLSLYSTVSLGGYGEALLLGNLVLLVGFSWIRQLGREDMHFPGIIGWAFLWGGLVGIGLWANGLTLVYSTPMGLAILWEWVQHSRKMAWKWQGGMLLACVAGFALGAFPWWSFAIQNGVQALVLELGGKAVSVETDTWLLRSAKHLVSLILLGGTALFGFRPPWEVRWLAMPLAPFALVFWLGTLLFFGRVIWQKNPKRTGYRVLLGVCLTVSAGFVFTAFGVDPSGRYFLPLAPALALAAGGMLERFFLRLRWQVMMVGLVVVFQAWGTLQCVGPNLPGLTTQFDAVTIIDHQHDQELISFLTSQRELRGYSNYWVAYPLAFLSQERIIFIPRLPYHQDLRYTPRDDRYAPYNQEVNGSQQVAYISVHNPRLEELLRREMARLDVSWREKTIGDYHVFYQLSRALRPAEMGLGELWNAEGQ